MSYGDALFPFIPSRTRNLGDTNPAPGNTGSRRVEVDAAKSHDRRDPLPDEVDALFSHLYEQEGLCPICFPRLGNST